MGSPLEVDLERAHHSDVWDNKAYSPAVWQVSLCHASNEEIRCIALCDTEEDARFIAEALFVLKSIPRLVR